MSMNVPPPAPEASLLPSGVRIAIAAARFNADIVDELLAGCRQRLHDLGLTSHHLHVHRVPGAFELPVTAKVLVDTHRYAAVICLGAVIRGDTPHFDYVAGETARGIQAVATATGVPVVFGVLTVNTHQQALDRVGGSHGHAGVWAADAAAEMIAVVHAIKSWSPDAA